MTGTSSGVGLGLRQWALLISAQAGSAQTRPSTVKATGHPVWTLAMDWPRVAYASGKDGNSESIHVWNVATGSTSVISGGGGSNDDAVHHTGELVITGRRVVWLRSRQFGNTELNHWLYTAPIGGTARLLRRAFGGAATGCAVSGGGTPRWVALSAQAAQLR